MDTTSDSEIAHSIINLSSSSLIGSSSLRGDQQQQEDSLFIIQRSENDINIGNNEYNDSPVEAEKMNLRKGRPTRKKGRLHKQSEEDLEELHEPMPIPTVSSSRRGKKAKNQSPTSPYQSVFPQVVTPSYYQQGMFQPPFAYPQYGNSRNSNQVYQYPQTPYSPYIISPPSSSKKKSKSKDVSDDEEYDEKSITFSQTLPPITIPQVRLPPGTQPVYIVVPVPQPMYHSNYSPQPQYASQQEQDNSSDSDYQTSIVEDDIEDRPTKKQSEKKRKIDEEEKAEEMKRKRIEIDDNNDSLFDKLAPGEGILYRRRRKLNTKHKAEEANGCSDRMYSLFPKISTCCGKTKSLAYNGSQAGKGYHYILKYKPTQAESDRLNQLIKENASLSLYVESSDSTKSPFACYSTLGKRTDNSPPVIAFRGASQYLECCFRVEKEGEKRHGISDSSSYTLVIKSGEEKIVASQPFKLISKEKPEEPCSKLPTCIRNRQKIE